MDGLREFLDAVREHGLVAGNLRGLFHVAIGRRITRPDGAVVSTGVTWRELANLFKGMRFDKELVAEVGGDPEELSPRDRQRFWYAAITLARPDSPEARAEADRLAAAVKPLGFVVGPPPSPGGKPAPAPGPEPTPPEAEKSKKKKK
ncbi:MAG TPA: hypothetical protein VFG68_18745 [Fimbriiglobus sp.]|nr:hypothetical protein [Fimbriiglobus sp.]